MEMKKKNQPCKWLLIHVFLNLQGYVFIASWKQCWVKDTFDPGHLLNISLDWPTEACSEHFHQPTVEQSHPTQSLFYDKVLDISCNLLSTVPNMKSRMVVWIRMVVSGLVVKPLWSRGWLGAAVHLHCPALSESVVLRIASLGEGHNLYYSFYWTHSFDTIVVLKNEKSNHHKLDCFIKFS